MNAARIAFLLDRADDVALLLPVADALAARGGAEPVLAAVGREAAERLSMMARDHVAPEGSDWFTIGNPFDLVVCALVAPERGGLARHVAHELAQRGIPCLAVEADPGRPPAEPFAVHLALAGGASYARALAAGWSQSKIATTGSPLFEEDAREIATSSKGDDRENRILVVSAFSRVATAERQAFERGLCAFAASRPAMTIEVAEGFGWHAQAAAARELVAAIQRAGGASRLVAMPDWRRRVAGTATVVTEDLAVALCALSCRAGVMAIEWAAPPDLPGERTAPLRACDVLALPAGCVSRAGQIGTALLAPRTREFENARAQLRSFVEQGPPRASARIAALAVDLASRRLAAVETALAQVRSGNELLSKDRGADAEAAYIAALGSDPANTIALNNLGVLLADRGADDEALMAFERLIALDPGDDEAHLMSARLLAKRGRWWDAARQVEVVLTRDPHHRKALLLLAEIYLDAGIPEQATGLYDQAGALGPLDGPHSERRARAAFLSGLPDEARPARTLPLSIVIVAYNSAEDLPDCLDSIARHTRVAHEVVVVDNASSDGTRALLRARAGIRLEESDENIGYSRAANLGLRHARGEAVILLNPDTVVTEGWAERMLAHVAPGVGAVGPLSNYVAGEQKFELHAALPAGRIGVDELVKIIGEKNAGRARQTKLLIGFCMLVTREALDRCGLLDEDLFLGNDDLEYSWRLRRAGLSLLIATNAFVFHKGQRSFQSEPSEKTRRLVEESTNALQAKLEAVYGAGGVPTPQELWGIGWFQPTRRAGVSPSRAAAAASAPNETPLTSIVIVTWNELEYTKKCVAAIERHTPEPHEILFVDNGSTDGTPEWLATLAGTRLIRNATNQGFAAGANAGIRAARGERVLLLNNDVIVTEGWLAGLSRHLDAQPSCGLVGPVSNYVSGPQLDVAASYDTMDAMAEHAARTHRAQSGRAEEARRLVGFCLLVRADVFRAIGLFDEGFGMGNFEDDDLCIRAALGGWRLLIARDVFVHHFGSRTFIGNKINYRDSLEKNKAYFLEKWRAARVS